METYVASGFWWKNRGKTYCSQGADTRLSFSSFSGLFHPDLRWCYLQQCKDCLLTPSTNLKCGGAVISNSVSVGCFLFWLVAVMSRQQLLWLMTRRGRVFNFLCIETFVCLFLVGTLQPKFLFFFAGSSAVYDCREKRCKHS